MAFYLQSSISKQYISIGKQVTAGYFNLEASINITDERAARREKLNAENNDLLLYYIFNQDDKIFLTTDDGYQFTDNGVNYSLLQATYQIYANKHELYFDPVTQQGAYKIYNKTKTQALTIKNYAGVDLVCLMDLGETTVADTWITIPTV